MKKHLISIWFDVGRHTYCYTGFVTGRIDNGHLQISPSKIFRNAFGFDLPDYTKITIN